MPNSKIASNFQVAGIGTSIEAQKASPKAMEEFKLFLVRELAEAEKELKKITKESSRKHLQKLVYTNLVDRFDHCVDKTLLSMIETSALLEEMLGKHKKDSFTEEDVLRFMLAESPRQLALERLKDTLRQSTLRGRHSEKLCKLLRLHGAQEDTLNKPRVNRSNGAILATYKPSNNSVPSSIKGYADWLYSRRNSIVHGGGGTQLQERDKIFLKEQFKFSGQGGVKISLGSITSAGRFYSDLVNLICAD